MLARGRAAGWMPFAVCRRGLAIHRWEPRFVAEHQRRMAWSPHLYLKNRLVYPWAAAWQEQVQQEVRELNSTHVETGKGCFVAPCAVLVATPGKGIELGRGSSVAAESFLRGPVRLAAHASVNPRCTLDGGRAGITIGEGSRIATGCHFFAFNHGMAPDAEVRAQATTSKGIAIGKDVWVGAGAGIVDGVTVGDHAVVGMGSVVTRDVPPWAIVAGNPARRVGDRRDKGDEARGGQQRGGGTPGAMQSAATAAAAAAAAAATATATATVTTATAASSAASPSHADVHGDSFGELPAATQEVVRRKQAEAKRAKAERRAAARRLLEAYRSQ